MRNTVRRASGLVLTTMLFAGSIAWTGSGNRLSPIPPDKPKDGFPGIPAANSAGFETYVQKLGFGTVQGSVSIEEPFPCIAPAGCGGQSTVTLRVIPSEFSSDVNWKDATGNGKGHVVAKIVVVDPVPYDRFNLVADDVAYLWIGNNQGGKGAALYRVRAGKVTMVYRFTDIRYCKTSIGYQPPTVHNYMTAKCTDPDPTPAGAAAATSATTSSIVTLASSKPTNSFAVTARSGLWVSCAGGCCEVQY